MTDVPLRYTSADEDSGRWQGFDFRPGDIVISTRSKSGTTWAQAICLMLVFQSPALPAPLAEISPWLDHLVEPLDDVVRRLDAQRHRRVIKTHTPLDGLPLDPRATYVVVGRQPLDMAVSLYHQGDNIDRARLRELTGATAAAAAGRPRPALRDWLMRWVDEDVAPRDSLDSLPGVAHHMADAWARRERCYDVVLLHYHDLESDLGGQMQQLAARLDLPANTRRWPELVAAARFASMRDRAAELVPDRSGVLKDSGAFFRRGSSGAGRELLSGDEVAHYAERLAALAPPDVVAWLNR